MVYSGLVELRLLNWKWRKQKEKAPGQWTMQNIPGKSFLSFSCLEMTKEGHLGGSHHGRQTVSSPSSDTNFPCSVSRDTPNVTNGMTRKLLFLG